MELFQLDLTWFVDVWQTECRAFNHAALFVDPTLPFHEFKNKVIRLPDGAFGDLTKT